MIDPAFSRVDEAAVEQFLWALADAGVAHEVRTHEPPRHARHLASLWGAHLHEAGRATLFKADDEAVLVIVPADRKIGAPRLRALLGATDLRVLRGDRGVGRIGWSGIPGPPGALPVVPAMFGARGLVDRLVLSTPRLIIALAAGRSVALGPHDYVRLTGSAVARCAGTTRLLPEGGLVEDDPYR